MDELRSRRMSGEKASALVRFLMRDLGMRDDQAIRYLDEAFVFPDGRLSLLMLKRASDGSFIDPVVDDALEPDIERARDAWVNVAAYPDLMRRRDRHTFREVAQSTNTIIIVKAAGRHTAEFIGAPGYRPSPPRLPAVARACDPHQGLMAADPQDASFREFLQARFGNTDYAAYLGVLRGLGFSVDSAETGYVIRDAARNRFYPGYVLLGVYSAANHRSAWTGRDGEKIRSMLNRRLGEDLIQWGPHDDAELRNPNRGRFDGPQVPALCFLPSGDIETRRTVEDLASFYIYNDLNWKRLVPVVEHA